MINRIERKLKELPYPYHRFRDGILINGDCFEVKAFLPENSIDVAFEDIPYGMSKAMNTYWKVTWDLVDIDEFAAETLESNKDLLVNGGMQFLWASDRYISQIRKIAEKMEYQYLTTITWFKTMGRIVNDFSSCTEYLAVMRKGNERPYFNVENSSQRLNFIMRPMISLNRERLRDQDNRLVHPTQKPIDICHNYIKMYCKPGGTVLDGVSGTGTTACAVISLGEDRKFILIEKDKGYYDAAIERIKAFEKEPIFENQIRTGPYKTRKPTTIRKIIGYKLNLLGEKIPIYARRKPKRR